MNKESAAFRLLHVETKWWVQYCKNNMFRLNGPYRSRHLAGFILFVMKLLYK